MAYDSTKPADNSQIIAAELRSQFQGLKALIDALQSQVNDLRSDLAAVPTSDSMLDVLNANTAHSVDAVPQLTLSISNPPTQPQVQGILNRLNDLIGELHH